MDENKLVVQNEFSNDEIKNLIYTVRGKQVMLDSDVAMLYHYETKKINQAVKRNIDRFPEDFCFQLTKNEMDKMWFQIGTTNKDDVIESFDNTSLRSQIVTLNEGNMNLDQKNNWSQIATSSS